MFLVLSDLSLVTRKDLALDSTYGILVTTSGVQGTWVTLTSNSQAALPTGPTKLAWPIFNESRRDQILGSFAPDVGKTGRVTILAGKYFARTTVYTGSVTVGQYLEVTSTGALASGVGATATAVAMCTVAPRAYTYLGNSVNAMDIYVF